MTVLTKALPQRPVVRIVHPCGSTVREITQMQKGVEVIANSGCEVRWDEMRAKSSSRDYLSADDERRAEEFIAALREPDCDIVWIAKGGSGSLRILPAILEAAASLPPKVIIGISDACVLLNVISERLGWITWHGPGVTDLGSVGKAQFDFAEAFTVLRGEKNGIQFRTSRSGKTATGILRGGNMTAMASLVGTPFALHCDEPTIWFFEDNGEMPERLDRCYTQMRLSGLMETSAAIWLGDLALPSCHTRTAHEALAEDFDPVPLVNNAPAGHNGKIQLLPIGGRCRLEPSIGCLFAESPWVEPA